MNTAELVREAYIRQGDHTSGRPTTFTCKCEFESCVRRRKSEHKCMLSVFLLFFRYINGTKMRQCVKAEESRLDNKTSLVGRPTLTYLTWEFIPPQTATAFLVFFRKRHLIDGLFLIVSRILDFIDPPTESRITYYKQLCLLGSEHSWMYRKYCVVYRKYCVVTYTYASFIFLVDVMTDGGKNIGGGQPTAIWKAQRRLVHEAMRLAAST